MDWLSIGKKIATLGLPMLGTALGGPLGGAIGGMIANALGVEPTPAAVDAAIGATPNDVLIQKLKSVEAVYQSELSAQADLYKTEASTIADTIKTELEVPAGPDWPGWFGAFQRGWRPAFAWELLLECTAGAILFLHEAWTSDFSTLSAILQFEGFLTWYYGLRFAVIGVFGIGRSAEKVAAIKNGSSLDDDGVIGSIVKKVLNKLGR